MNETITALTSTLKQHQILAQQILQLVEQESIALAQSDTGLPFQTATAKRALLPQLNASLLQLRRGREEWQRLSPAERAQAPHMPQLFRATQDLLMKIILRDRENEQRLLRQGRIPAEHMSKAQPVAKPHYVADLYRRHRAA